ncbi:HNH endonuclease [Enterobacter ludwigii]|uniref:HNH endonuclease signature motif containing protein n=1 Tax=Enterobacter ludwigii TaxID=299767 RepID=UPI001D170DD8|nr:HNH endonuclease signature motif containing protein [Enterobacter ludwigii]UEG31618.1 HNH endonuclease [Enterobacter ludwigii]UEG39473.1 HNH endonuclease [Enterobacter ludwigii]UEG40305.1 HNH endonuclease [Enterobacter ludwigii]
MKKARSQLRIVDDIYALGLDGCILSISTDGVKGKLKISHDKKTIITGFWPLSLKTIARKNIRKVVLRVQEGQVWLVYTGTLVTVDKDGERGLVHLKDVNLVGQSTVKAKIFNHKMGPKGVTYVEHQINLTEKPQVWREGVETIIMTRPDQSPFAKAVRQNCKNRCIVTNTKLKCMTEAAHLTPHCNRGVPDKRNGLLMRRDIHALFDAHEFAIHPDTLCLHFSKAALKELGDAIKFKKLTQEQLESPIDNSNLWERWEIFCNQHPIK